MRQFYINPSSSSAAFSWPVRVAVLLAVIVAFVISVQMTVITTSSTAYAQSIPAGVVQTVRTDCMNGAYATKVTVRAVYCMKGLLQATTQYFIQGLSTYLQPIFWAAATLMIALFGFRVTFGMEENIVRSGMQSVFRLIVAASFMSLMPVIYLDLFNFMDSLVNWITQQIANSPTFGISSVCTVANNPGWATQPNASYLVWHELDCLLGRFIGYAGAFTAGAGILGLVLAAFFTGGVGLFVFMITVTAAIALFLMIFRPIYLYLLAYMALSFMIIISPLVFISLLFKNTEERFFKKWLGYTISVMVQPAIVVGFLFIVLSLLNDFVYDGVPSATAGGEPIIVSINEILTSPGTISGKTLAQTIGTKELFPGWRVSSDDEGMWSRFTSTVRSTLSGLYSLYRDPKKAAMNGLTQLATGLLQELVVPVLGMDPRDLYDKLIRLAQTLTAMLVLGLGAIKFMECVPELASVITGSKGIFLSKPQDNDSKGDPGRKLRGAAAGLGDGMKSAINNGKGLGGTLRSGVGGAMSGFKNV